MEEIFNCIQFLKLSYNDLMKMPTYERRYFILLNNRKVEMDNETYEENKLSTSGKKRISGEALKNKLKNKEIDV